MLYSFLDSSSVNSLLRSMSLPHPIGAGTHLFSLMVSLRLNPNMSSKTCSISPDFSVAFAMVFTSRCLPTRLERRRPFLLHAVLGLAGLLLFPTEAIPAIEVRYEVDDVGQASQEKVDAIPDEHPLEKPDEPDHVLFVDDSLFVFVRCLRLG